MADETYCVCLYCKGRVVEERGKLVCRDCGRINESCCEGSRQ